MNPVHTLGRGEKRLGLTVDRLRGQQDVVIKALDEVISGFRFRAGDVGTLYGVQPDLATYGKIIGGGMPVGAFGGKREYMEQVAPVGPVYQAGTLSGNPVAMAAGLANLEIISRPGFFEALAERTEQLTCGLQQAADAAGVPVRPAIAKASGLHSAIGHAPGGHRRG